MAMTVETVDARDTDETTAPPQRGRPRVPTPTRARRSARPDRRRPGHRGEPALEVEDLDVWYGTFRAVNNVTLAIPPRAVTAIIGPSGCGKSTFLRTLNRMHELTPGARVEGQVILDGDRHLRPGRRSGRSSGGSWAWSSSGRTRSRRCRSTTTSPSGLQADRPRTKGRPRRASSSEPPPLGAVGRGQGQAPADRDVALGRAAAAAVHRPGARGRPRGDPDGRAASALDPIATLRIEELIARAPRERTRSSS